MEGVHPKYRKSYVSEISDANEKQLLFFYYYYYKQLDALYNEPSAYKKITNKQYNDIQKHIRINTMKH